MLSAAVVIGALRVNKINLEPKNTCTILPLQKVFKLIIETLDLLSI